jgi:D,D-heptose 1,7-bisphosphate phosphatase
MNKALFLDRDGVLNIDKGYVYRWEDLVWIEEIFDIIKIANERGYKVIILTNQSGIHHGMYTKEDVHLLHKKMEEFLVNKGLRIDDWYYCSEMDSLDRKPRPGMLLAAQKKHDIDFSKSFMIGDKSTDVFETDGSFKRPTTLLIRGNYELNHPDIGSGVKIFDNHVETLQEIKKVL